MMAVDSMSLRERAAQLLFPRLGSNMRPPVSAAGDVGRFEALLADCPVGGLIVFNGTYPHATDALVRLQQGSRTPLLVCADMERGVGQQIRGATVFPHAMAYASIHDDDQRLLTSSARIQAREALGCGIHVTFSPVADVNRDPRNPIIATRAFSSDPDVAAHLVRAFIRGCRAEGLLCTAKHFPGHGNTSRDSHAELPVVTSNADEIDAFDLIPFKAAVEAGTDLVMSAHVLYPALDPVRPATLSPVILRDVLRRRLGFKGAVVSDSLLMGAIRDSHADTGEQAVALVHAGVDILLDVPDPEAAAAGIARAVETGHLEGVLLDEAVGRVLALKRRILDRFGGALFASPQSIIGPDEIGSDANRSVAERVARAAVAIVDDREGRLPLDPTAAGEAGVVVLLVRPHRSHPGAAEEPFQSLMRDALPGARCWHVGPDEEAGTLDAIAEAAERAQLAVIALIVKPAAWHAIGLLPEQNGLVRRIIQSVPSVVASLGSPYVLEQYDEAAARLCTFSDVESSQRALVDCLLGR